jgi:Ankyrin repeats (3 copies)
MQNNQIFWAVIALQIIGAGALSAIYSSQQAESVYETNQRMDAKQGDGAPIQVQVDAPTAPTSVGKESTATVVGPITTNNDLEQSGIGITPLMIAAGKGDELEVARLLGEGASVLDQTKFGNTALIYAAGAGHIFCVQQLINAGADPRHFNSDGDNALSLARQRGHQNVVEALSK